MKLKLKIFKVEKLGETEIYKKIDEEMENNDDQKDEKIKVNW